MIEQTLHAVKIDLAIYLTLSIIDIVKNVLLYLVGKSY